MPPEYHCISLPHTLITKIAMKSLFRKVILTAALIAASVSAMAQQVTASGVVKDSKGIPVIGASVIQTGTNNGVISDIDGAFSLNVPEGAILAVSSIGYKTVNVAAASDMEIILEDDNELLDEVVVVGYGVQKKSDLTGAISSVNSKDIENRTITSAGQALQGKTAGVNLITTSAQPGASPTIRVRGFSSNGTSDPLYVVDGLIMSDIANLDPNFI